MCTKLLRFSLLLGVFCTCLFAGAQTKIDDIMQGDFEIAIYDNLTAQITRYRGAFPGELVLPNKVVYENTDFTVTSIGASAFSVCAGLTSVSFPEGLTSIGEGAFYGCSDLTSVSFPEGLTSIGNRAFFGCSGLTSVSFPEGLTSIGEGAFSSCSRLTAWSLSDQNTAFAIEGSLLFNSDGSLVMALPTIKGAVQIPAGLTSIGASAFSGCSGLTSVSFPEGLTSIGEGAFLGCSRLTAWSLSDQNTAFAIEGSLLFNRDGSLVMALPTIKGAVQIPAGLTSIGASAFSRCSGLTSVSFPEGLTSIGASAFSSCSSLTSVSFPEGLTSIGTYAFSSCSGLTSVSFPEGLTSIGDGAFSWCSRLTSVSFPEGLTSIGEGAFLACSRLTSVSFPEGLTSIGNRAFSGCSGLTSVSFPEDLTSIGNRAFLGCSGLTSVSFPEGLSSIGGGAFLDCLSLQSWSISSDNPNFTIEGNYLFSKDKTELVLAFPPLKSDLSLSEGVTSIREEAFCCNENLISVSFPKSLISIGKDAFASCRNLTFVSFSESPISIGEGVFGECAIRMVEILALQPPKMAYVDDAFLRAFTSDAAVYVREEALVNYGGTFLGIPVRAIPTTSVTMPASGYMMRYTVSNYLMPEGAQGAVLKVEDNNMVLNYSYKAGDVVPARTPLLIKADAGRVLKFAEPIVTNGRLVEGTNMLEGRIISSKVSKAGMKYYILGQDSEGKAGFFYQAGTNGDYVNCEKGVPYLVVPQATAAQAYYLENAVETGVNSIQLDTPSADAPIYDLSGRRVKTPQRGGLYIQNGKKVIF